MSARRVYDENGKPGWEPIDDGAVGRTTHSRGPIPRMTVVETDSSSKKNKARDHQREYLRRKKAAKAEAAS